MKKNTLILTILMFVLLLCSSSYGEMYSWVDDNGKLQFSNTTPPSNGKVMRVDSEISTSEGENNERIKNKKIETEEDYEVRQEKIRERKKIAAEERKKQDRIKKEKAQKRKKIIAKIRAEERIINSKIKNYRNKCDKIIPSAVGQSNCRYNVKKRFGQVLSTLRKSPNYYFDNRYRIDRETDDIFHQLFGEYN